MKKQVAGWSLVVVLAFWAGGCGYAHKETYPKGIRTVAVPIFKNRSFYQGAEFDLTEAITKAIESRTPYKVVAPQGADTILEGTITNIEQVRLSRRADGGLPQEMEMRIVIDLAWKNLRTGQLIRDRKGLEAVGRYIPANPVGETYSIAQHQAAERLAGAVVSAMRADW